MNDGAQEKPQPGEDETQVVTSGGEDDVYGVALAAFEETASEVSVGLHVSDDGFDSRAAPELAFDDARTLRASDRR